jgi:hypothetical protein
MSDDDQPFLPDYDFTAALALSPAARIERAAKALRRRDSHVSSGASSAEVAELERRVGRPLPKEYALLLRTHRCLVVDENVYIGGLDTSGKHAPDAGWISDEHRDGRTHLVIGRYDLYADGDQILIDLDDSKQPVVVYLHEEGPRFEPFAPTVSLAVWRLVFEDDEEEDDEAEDEEGDGEENDEAADDE